MNSVVVGVGDCRVSRSPEDHLVTYALGSCIALVLYDPVARAGGLLHFMLPNSRIDPRGSSSPYMYADTGIPLLFESIYGLQAERRRLKVYTAGAAQLIADNGIFNIGKRNQVALRNLLWRHGVLITSEAMGGTAARSVGLEIATGRFWIREATDRERRFAKQA